MDKNIKDILLQIQTELKAPKNQHNSFGNYNFRSCEDILEALKPLLEKTKSALIISDEVVLIGSRYYIKATAILKSDNGEVSVTAYAREAEEKKGMDVSQITGASSSYARKYALNGLFAIDDTKDADTKNNLPSEEMVEQTLSQEAEKAKEAFGGDIIDTDTPKCSICGQPVTNAKTINYSMQKYGKIICYKCQHKDK